MTLLNGRFMNNKLIKTSLSSPLRSMNAIMIGFMIIPKLPTFFFACPSTRAWLNFTFFSIFTCPQLRGSGWLLNSNGHIHEFPRPCAFLAAFFLRYEQKHWNIINFNFRNNFPHFICAISIRNQQLSLLACLRSLDDIQFSRLHYFLVEN